MVVVTRPRSERCVMEEFKTIEVFVNFYGNEIRKKFPANTPPPVINDWVQQAKLRGVA